MHGPRTALRYSPSTYYSLAGARSRGWSTVLPFGSGWAAPSSSGVPLVVRGAARRHSAIQLGLSHWTLEYLYYYCVCVVAV